MAGVDGGGPVEGPRAPEDDRRGEDELEPGAGGEGGQHHGQQEDRHREGRRDDEPRPDDVLGRGVLEVVVRRCMRGAAMVDGLCALRAARALAVRALAARGAVALRVLDGVATVLAVVGAVLRGPGVGASRPQLAQQGARPGERAGRHTGAGSGRRADHAGAVAGLLDLGDDLLDGHRRREGDERLLRREVDRCCLDARDLAELALDAGRARGAGHAGDREPDLLRRAVGDRGLGGGGHRSA